MDKQKGAPNLAFRAEVIWLKDSQKEVAPAGEKEWGEKVKREGLSVLCYPHMQAVEIEAWATVRVHGWLQAG